MAGEARGGPGSQARTRSRPPSTPGTPPTARATGGRTVHLRKPMGPGVDSALGGGAGRGRKDSSQAAAVMRARKGGGPAFREWRKRGES